LILSATSTVAVGDFDQANAIRFSPDENQLYISGASGSPSNRVFVVGDDGTLTNGRVFHDSPTRTVASATT